MLSLSNRPSSGVELLADTLAWIIAVWIHPTQQIPPSHNEEKVVCLCMCVSVCKWRSHGCTVGIKREALKEVQSTKTNQMIRVH